MVTQEWKLRNLKCVSGLSGECEHPVILSKKSKVTNLIVQWCHYNTAHSGRGIVIDLNEIWWRGSWGSSVIKSAIFKCVTWQKIRGRIRKQMIADLPKDIFKEGPPFIHCTINIFGTFIVRLREKWYETGAMFTCLAVHIKVTHSPDTDSFIQALRRLIACRGNVRQMCFNNGSNFKGARIVKII